MHYAVVFETQTHTTGTGPSGTFGDSGTEIALKDMILKALREDTSLPLDVRSLSFEPTTLNLLKELPTDKPRHLPGFISTEAAVAISEETTESINNSEEEVAPNGAQGTDKEATESTFPTQETRKHLPSVTTLVTITDSSPPEPSGGPKLKEAEERNLMSEAEGITLFRSKKQNTQDNL